MRRLVLPDEVKRKKAFRQVIKSFEDVYQNSKCMYVSPSYPNL